MESYKKSQEYIIAKRHAPLKVKPVVKVVRCKICGEYLGLHNFLNWTKEQGVPVCKQHVK